MQAILLPAVAMMLLTCAVLVVLFKRRIGTIKKKRIHPQSILTPEKLAAQIDDDYVAAPANCLRNMTEVPVLFYALCGFIAIMQLNDALYVALAWLFVSLRTVHAFIHCGYNKVMHRFYAYLASCFVLLLMLLRFFWQLL